MVTPLGLLAGLALQTLPLIHILIQLAYIQVPFCLYLILSNPLHSQHHNQIPFMALTRHATGHSAPRKTTNTTTVTTTTSPTARKKKTTTLTRPKANTSKPRAQATTSGRVTKSRAPATKNPPRKTSVKDKVEGVLEKIVGTVEGRPGKKVRSFRHSPFFRFDLR